jgi:UPF0148 protein
MAERSSDEIMAEYLLQGARMLSRSCPTCGSPLFEIKGETRCVVCPEKGREAVTEKTVPPETMERRVVQGEVTSLAAELSRSLCILCRRVQEEPDPERCRILMEAIGEGIKALQLLSQ